MKKPALISAVLDGSGTLIHDSHPGVAMPWWSVTKTVIATCLLKLADQGRVSLDETLPGKPYSARHLVTHQAWVPNYTELESYHQAIEAGEDPWSTDRLLNEVGADTLKHPPGKGWAYSNTGYLILRRYLEDACDAALGDLLQDTVLGPMGLSGVTLAENRNDMAVVPWPEAHAYHPGWVYHGCLLGSAADAARFMHGLLAGHVLSPESLAQMTRPVMRDGPIPGRVWTEIGYGCGLMTGKAGNAGRVMGHSGCGPFSACFVGHVPDLTCTVASFCDKDDEAPAEWDGIGWALAVTRLS